MSTKKFQFCNNCGKTGHMFHRCKKPITSIGIIVFKIVNGARQYLMICRRNSLGYVDFMRGKYPLSNKIYLKNIIYEMTNEEKQSLLKNEFDDLWTRVKDSLCRMRLLNRCLRIPLTKHQNKL